MNIAHHEPDLPPSLSFSLFVPLPNSDLYLWFSYISFLLFVCSSSFLSPKQQIAPHPLSILSQGFVDIQRRQKLQQTYTCSLPSFYFLSIQPTSMHVATPRFSQHFVFFCIYFKGNADHLSLISIEILVSISSTRVWYSVRHILPS